MSPQAPKGCRMRLGTVAGIRPHHPNPRSATQEGSAPPRHQGLMLLGKLPRKPLSSHFAEPFNPVFWDPDLPC